MKWEYNVMEIDETSLCYEELDKMGINGWELVTIVKIEKTQLYGTVSTLQCIYKKPLLNE